MRLQVAVNMPASMDPIRADDVGDALAERIASNLHEQGFRGRIQPLLGGENATASIPLLEVNLIEWRVNHVGNVDCRFGATLKTPGGEKRLGQFSGTAMTWATRDWFSRDEGFDESVRNAVDDLWRKIQETGLLPDSAPGRDMPTGR